MNRNYLTSTVRDSSFNEIVAFNSVYSATIAKEIQKKVEKDMKIGLLLSDTNLM